LAGFVAVCVSILRVSAIRFRSIGTLLLASQALNSARHEVGEKCRLAILLPDQVNRPIPIAHGGQPIYDILTT